MSPAYPFAERDDVVDDLPRDLPRDLAGHRVADPYRWLEDRDDVRTIEWEAAQDYLVGPLLAGLPGRDRLRGRLTALSRTGAVGVPVWRDGRAFFTRREPEQEHAALLVREPDGAERVLIDPGGLDPAGTTTLDAWRPSDDGALLAYQSSVGGDEESLLYVLDVATGKQVDGPIDRCRYSPVAWCPGGRELYYVRRIAAELAPPGEEQFHRRVYRHTVGADPRTDVEIHGAGLDPTNYYGVSVCGDGRWLVVTASAGTAPRTDVWIADLSGAGALAEVQAGIDAQWGLVQHLDGTLYVHTDRDAPRGRLVAVDPAAPDPAGWRDVVPEQPDAVLADAAVLDGPVVLAVHGRDATDRLSWWDAATGKLLGPVAGHDAGSITGVRSTPDGGRTAWAGYTDFGTPGSVLQWSLDDPKSTAVWATAPGHVALPGLTVTQEHYRSADGTEVHLFVLSTGDRDGPRPTILYGYGGFNISLTPDYSAVRLAWVEAGGVYAIANLRGGSEHGEEWHRAGMRERKQNVFDDFAAAARHLADTGWTTREQLGIFGGSNGGLLVGATVTQNPQLCAAAVCSAPLLDMVRYELFGLGLTWNDEFGTAHRPEELAWLLGYSPCHNVHDGTDYPAVLFTVFDRDTRVDPVHARKLAAALQAATSGDRPILLRREADVGHGARSVSRTVALSTDQLAFLAAQLGLALERPVPHGAAEEGR